MQVNVAGAGAGKTTKMAKRIIEFKIPDGKIIFCIAFTNAAKESIKNKIIMKIGSLPKNIKISTIHSFLYQEIIKPYFFFLYRKQFDRLSAIDLPDDIIFRNFKLKDLENSNILHCTKIPEKAKWVVYKKSSDKKHECDIRRRILNYFSSYCAAIFVDEAQDIDKDIKLILESIDSCGTLVFLYGDPKQDIKGLGYFKKIMDKVSDIHYIPESYRCPQNHLDLSNRLASKEEQQFSVAKNKIGSINIVFESDIEDKQKFVSEGNFGLKYISHRTKRYETHKQKNNNLFKTLYFEIINAVKEKWEGKKSSENIERLAFYTTETILKEYNIGNKNTIIKKCINNGAFNKLDKKQYARIVSILSSPTITTSNVTVPVVSSIESIKGLEAERCLFILTPDLAPYLFHEKIFDNKESHLTYVALTRSLSDLTLLITEEVEYKYEKPYILSFFNN